MELLPIGVVAARSGMAASALRYYEDQGLLPAELRGREGALLPTVHPQLR